jgi:hypothetical protein
MTELVVAAEGAVLRFEEVSRLAQERLAHFRAEGARDAVFTGGLPAQEALSSLSWVSCMLLSTAEEALQAKHNLAVAGERSTSDHLQRTQLSLADVHRELAVVAAERDALRAEAQQLGSRMCARAASDRRRASHHLLTPSLCTRTQA